jgi:DNA-binding winged helix-turn-helix (wHTH) protein
MTSEAHASRLIHFGDFAIDPHAGELFKKGTKIKLQQQPFQVLAILLERPGDLVTREELRERIWPADTFVDFDHSLNTAVKKLRQALGDGSQKPRYVETLPRKGYRFLGTVKGAEKGAPPPATKRKVTSKSVGRVFVVRGEGEEKYLLAAVDEASRKERERLDAANDDVGFSLLIAQQRVLLLPAGLKVRVIEAHDPGPILEVRILEGEHYGRTALLTLSQLADTPPGERRTVASFFSAGS